MATYTFNPQPPGYPRDTVDKTGPRAGKPTWRWVWKVELDGSKKKTGEKRLVTVWRGSSIRFERSHYRVGDLQAIRARNGVGRPPHVNSAKRG